MDWDPQNLDHAERVLNRGQPSGPRLDKLWAHIQPGLTPALVPWWKRPWAWALVPALAAGLLVMQPAQFHERGAARAAAVVLETTCGSIEQPCHVGQPVFVRVGAHSLGGQALVLLQSGFGRVPLGPPLVLDTVNSTPLDVKLVPNALDTVRGLTLRLYWSPQPMDLETREKMLRGEDVVDAVHILKLDVVP